jgi:argininosuccinate synthase
VVAQRYAEIGYNGQWFTTLRKSLDAFFETTQEFVTGTVRLKLYKGNIIPVGRKSEFSLYREDFATFGQDSVYDQTDAEGFITLFGLPLKVQAMRQLVTTQPKGAVPENLETPDYSKFKRD